MASTIDRKRTGSSASRNGLSATWSRLWNRIEGAESAATSYYLVLGCTLALTAIGLLMVLSASSVENIDSGGSYQLFLRQGIFGIVGLIAMVVISRLRPAQLKRLAWPALVVALFLLTLVVTPLGVNVGGNQNWIRIGGFSAQPSEMAKLALAVWGAAILERKAHLLDRVQHLIVPVLFPVGLVILGFVLYGRDLGTALVIMLILVMMIYLAGFPLKWFAVALAVGAVAALVLTVISENRMVRVQAWLGDCSHVSDPCYQSDHGMAALATGGWWGVGLGQSRQKWSYIPEAENDFIFTILGEELGLLGTLLVLALFAGLAVGLYRVARRADTAFVRIATGAILAWVIGQAFINIAMVTGVMPVIGIPLPFISNGGSALVAVLMAMGVALCFARDQRRRAERAVTSALPPVEGSA